MVASFLLPLLLLASSQLAMPVSARPSSPLTSLNNNKALRSIQSRQARSADVVRRMKSGPRRRADPSILPSTCPAASGYNLLSDGDFQALGTSLACFSSSSTTSSGQGFVAQGSFAYQEDSDGAEVNDHYSYMLYASGGPAIISLSQTVAVTAGDMYDFSFRLGVAKFNTVACPITVTLDGPANTLLVADLCSDSSQCTSSGNGVWTQLSIANVVVQDSITTVKISWDCSAVGAENSSYYYMADDLVLGGSA